MKHVLNETITVLVLGKKILVCIVAFIVKCRSHFLLSFTDDLAGRVFVFFIFSYDLKQHALLLLEEKYGRKEDLCIICKILFMVIVEMKSVQVDIETKELTQEHSGSWYFVHH